MEAFGAFSGIFGLFVLVVAVLAFLLPLFVLRIRNEIISMNKKMSTLVRLLGDNEHIQLTDTGKRVKICSSCGAKNRQEDYTCINCNEPLL